jgi:hypothetical protein
MISPQQIKVLHIYAHAAGLNDATYRSYLREHAAVNSSTDPAMDQAGFETTLASIEAVLWDRVDRDLAPIPTSPWIKPRGHWQGRRRGGLCTTRQLWLIGDLWRRLQPYLHPDARDAAYLLGIIEHAVGRRVGYQDLTVRDAGALIDALRDRLQYALHAPAQADVPTMAGLPF